jgi:hypothetical protein
VGVALDDHGVALYVSNSEDSTVILALDAMKGVDGQPLPIPAGCEWIPSGPVAWQASMAVAAGRCSETRYGLMSWRGAQPVFDRFGEVEVIERLATDPTGQNLLASYSGGDSYGPIVQLRHDSQSLAYRHTLVANDTACSSLDPARHCVTSADW